MSYNVDLMQEVRGVITVNPESHDQSMWGRQTECGTTYCIAGWALRLAGKKFLWGETTEGGRSIASHVVDDDDQSVSDIPVVDYSSISDVARDLLGLNWQEAHYLFAGFNTEAHALKILDAMIEAGKEGRRLSRRELVELGELGFDDDEEDA